MSEFKTRVAAEAKAAREREDEARSRREAEAARLLELLEDASGSWHPYPIGFPTNAVAEAFLVARSSGRIEVDQINHRFRVRSEVEMAKAHQTRRRRRRERRRDELLAERQRIWQSSGVAPRFRDANLRSLHGIPEAYRRVALALFGLLTEPGLVALVGPTGRGKTEIGSGLVREFCHRGRSARYVKASGLFEQVKETYRAASSVSESDVKLWLSGWDLLVIDELDNRNGSPWEANQLDALIDDRYDQVQSTVLISNLPPEALAESLGPRIVSRLQQTGRVFECSWESFRTNGKARKADSGDVSWPPVRPGATPTHDPSQPGLWLSEQDIAKRRSCRSRVNDWNEAAIKIPEIEDAIE